MEDCWLVTVMVSWESSKMPIVPSGSLGFKPPQPGTRVPFPVPQEKVSVRGRRKHYNEIPKDLES